MAGGTSRPDLQPPQILLRVPGTAGLSGVQPLERYHRGSGEVASAAFRALVERHGPTVRRVCRQVLSDPHDAASRRTRSRPG